MAGKRPLAGIEGKWIDALIDFIESGYIAVVLANYDGAAAPVGTRIREFVGRIGRE